MKPALWSGSEPHQQDTDWELATDARQSMTRWRCEFFTERTKAMRELRNMASEDERTTVVNTQKLLTTLRENRKAHAEMYRESVDGYLETARDELERQYSKAQREVVEAYQRTKDELVRFDPSKARDTIVFCGGITFTLTAPRNYLDAYDQAIQMMEWETRETVELNATEFRCFVMDKWDWMESFKHLNTTYSKHK